MIELNAGDRRVRIAEGRLVVERVKWGGRWKPEIDLPTDDIRAVVIEPISPEQVGHRLIGKLPAVTGFEVRTDDQTVLLRIDGLSPVELRSVLRPVFGDQV